MLQHSEILKVIIILFTVFHTGLRHKFSTEKKNFFKLKENPR